MAKNKTAGKKSNNEDLPKKENLLEEYRLLIEKEKALDAEVENLKKAFDGDADLTPQMNALHDYNAMKDLTQNVLGVLENAEQSTLAELHLRYNLPLE